MPRPRPQGRRRSPEAPRPVRPAPRRALLVASVAFGLALVSAAIQLRCAAERDRPAAILAEAEAAARAQDWPRAFERFHALNATGARSARNLVVEARFAQAVDRGRAADLAAEAAARLDPRLADPPLIRLQRLRTLDRPAEALRLGLDALGAIADPRGRASVLAATTAAALAEVPDAEARAQLDRWIAADPDDVAARVARLIRVAATPHPEDPDRPARVAQLQALVDRHPDDADARAALVAALADSGEVGRGRALLDAWPDPRDERYARLRARWDLDFDRRPAPAVEGFRRVLAATPHDWRPHYGLARALHATGDAAGSAAESRAVARLRERLDPTLLGSRLADDLAVAQGTDPRAARRAARDLAALARSVGLAPLADAWLALAGLDLPTAK